MAKTKLVYFFGNGKGEGNASMKGELGGKGANLAEMASIGLPVPPGFTIATDVCDHFWKNNRNYPKELTADVDEYLGKLEKAMGKKLGDADDPLLVAVRSGAAVSMPGMMDTILNLGLNDKSVEGLAKKTNNERFAWDSYRRFIQMFGDVAMGVPGDSFEDAITELKAAKGITEDTDMTSDDLKNLVAKYKEIYKKHTGSDFPQDAKKQMWGAIDAVFSSWMNSRAIKYRELNEIKGLKGTAVTVMAMVFGNKGDTSGTGVCFSRDPSNGVNEFMGEYLMNKAKTLSPVFVRRKNFLNLKKRILPFIRNCATSAQNLRLTTAICRTWSLPLKKGNFLCSSAAAENALALLLSKWQSIWLAKSSSQKKRRFSVLSRTSLTSFCTPHLTQKR